MKGCTRPGNIAEGPHLMGLDPLREVEVSKKWMLGTTIHGTVLVHLIHSTF